MLLQPLRIPPPPRK
ncbi:rCG43575 [Rattus norvegicus]|uniref:RCG43575 n=1 Tax=Rattus norvegicus TaxID=10116 RepID=A6JJ13_RAT|nr:rCG43575 [Rattus norvegicus]